MYRIELHVLYEINYGLDCGRLSIDLEICVKGKEEKTDAES